MPKHNIKKRAKQHEKKLKKKNKFKKRSKIPMKASKVLQSKAHGDGNKPLLPLLVCRS
jgi:hypothetical protein